MASQDTCRGCWKSSTAELSYAGGVLRDVGFFLGDVTVLGLAYEGARDGADFWEGEWGDSCS
jgi:hypothetical protein